MIGYLEQLERDLIEAIELREEGRGRLRGRLHPRRLATAAAALAAAGAVVLLIVLLPSRPEHREATHPPVVHTTPAPVHIPATAPLRVVGTVTRVAPTGWEGQAVGPGGVAGTLTLSGLVDLARRPCCDTPRHLPPGAVNTIRFQWKVRGGEIEGSIRTSVLRRPHGRLVWDGFATRGVHATGVLRHYRGRSIGIAGDTSVSAPARARIILSQG